VVVSRRTWRARGVRLSLDSGLWFPEQEEVSYFDISTPF
jgi:hypothetical protein